MPKIFDNSRGPNIMGISSILNRVFASADYKKFEAMASFMGASKTALSIRMMQLGLLKRNDLSDPYRLVRVEMDEEDRML